MVTPYHLILAEPTINQLDTIKKGDTILIDKKTFKLL